MYTFASDASCFFTGFEYQNIDTRLMIKKKTITVYLSNGLIRRKVYFEGTNTP